jgi:acyl transferase domain-containing protein/acyl carrier protein/SAM-dependent methyltransferase
LGIFSNSREDLETKLKEVLSGLLKETGNSIDFDLSFMELNIDSILAVDFVEALNQSFGIDLGVDVIFDYRGIKELAEFILNQYAQEIQTEPERNIPAEPGTENETPPQKDIPSGASAQTVRDADIAIVGISGRFAGSENIAEFWRHLRDGDSCIREIHRPGWEEAEYYDADPGQINKSVSKWGGLLKEIDRFDALFFNISPLEAERMDPQQRLFLEEAYKALEDGGYSGERLSGQKVGVFVGGRTSDYKEQTLRETEINSQTFLGNDMSILAARISYFLNLKGPSLAVDTACSSSLVAVHLACESIRNRESEIALAGGVFAAGSPEFWVMTSQTGMLSPQGQCKTFDNDADGIVVGEGVGAMVLKPLRAAIADHDHIYGLIKGSAVNQDGRTKGITAPSMLSQKRLICEAYQKAGINPETVGYIEAHGTGTKLGDPIEVKALTEAFRMFTAKTRFCALGSHKPNFGHTIMSAGIAGVFKILMAMQYRTIPPAINLQEINQHIELQDSPFFINTQPQEWQRPTGAPLRAGVSSFGFSGTNCHLVIEEPPAVFRERASEPEKPYYIFPFSAKTSAALARKLADMERWLEREANNHESADIAYTLGMGRSHFPVRCVFVARDHPELRQRLREVMQNGTAEAYYKNEGLKPAQEEPVHKEFKTLGERVAVEIAVTPPPNREEYKDKLQVLAALYAAGYDIDWDKLFNGDQRRRIPMPTYPFVGERYWIPERKTQSAQGGVKDSFTALHPLLQQNTSDFRRQRFSSTFTGREFFLRDHRIQGLRVLPGVAYLEMARAAVEQSAGALRNEPAALLLSNVVWVRPIVVAEQPVEIHIGLYYEDNGAIAYEVYSETETEDSRPPVYSRGQAAFIPVSERTVLDLPQLRAGCNRVLFTQGQCYEIFDAMGIQYGAGHRGLAKLYVGGGQALAELALPESVPPAGGPYILHPSIMDAALQAIIGLLMSSGNSGAYVAAKPILPFALEELEIIAACTARMWAWIRFNEGSRNGKKVQKFDIDLCDQTGRVCVRMKAISTKVLDGGLAAASVTKTAPLTGELRLTPVWDAVPALKGEISVFPGERVVVVGENTNNHSALQAHYPQTRYLQLDSQDTIESIAEKLKAGGGIAHIVWISPDASGEPAPDEQVVKRQNQGVIQGFRLIKALLGLGYGGRELSWSVITIQAQAVGKDEQCDPAQAGVHGLIGSLAQEYPGWRIRLMDLEANCVWPVAEMFSLPADGQGNAWAWRGREWYRQSLVPVETTPSEGTLYKKGAVYVVIGGAGGVGAVWSEYMIRTYQARIIWIGRRPEDATVRAQAERLAAWGPAPWYIAADATDPQALGQAYAEIKKRYSQIDGLIHSAIVLADQSLANMDEDRFRAALAAKVDVSVEMARVFQAEPLDFVLFFSSIQSFTKAPGQSNYAAGCAFTDAFAHQMALGRPGVKIINWGYWGNVGSVAAPAYQERMARAGIGAIDPVRAMEVLESLLAGPLRQMAFINTTASLSLNRLNPGELLTVYPERIPAVPLGMGNRDHRPELPDWHVKADENQEMERLLCRLLREQMEAAGLFTEQRFRLADLQAKIGMRYLAGPWLIESLAVLVKNSYLRCDGVCYTVIAAPPDSSDDSAWSEWEQRKSLWMADPVLKGRVVLAEAALRALPEILTGQARATDIIFPGSSLALVEGVYKQNPAADYLNEVLADTLVSYIKERIRKDPAARIRILEIGAGTGGTSTVVFAKLKAYRNLVREYCYTDISQAFLLHAQKEYGPENPFLTYRIFNVEAPPAGQNVGADSYDIVVAANVLHATKNIRQTLRNAKAVLRRNGLILLNEITDNFLWMHLTFGLLEGWWLYEDREFRIPGCPALAPATWQAVLESEGFGEVTLPAAAAERLGQQIIVATSDGVVRQQQPAKPGITFSATGPKPEDRQTQRRQIASPSVATAEQREAGVNDRMMTEFVKATLVELISESLKVAGDIIDGAEAFMDYGLDSILGVRLIQGLNQILQIELATTSIFDHSSVNLLTAHIVSQYREQIAAAVSRKTPPADIPPEDTAVSGPIASPASPAPPCHLKRGVFSRLDGHRKTAGPRDVAANQTDKSVAIIGMSGRFAQSQTVGELWEHLANGHDLVEEVSRWDLSGFYAAGDSYCNRGSFLDDIEQFDPRFFNISGLEATYMDPQQRFFLEECWKALEDAGYAGSGMQGRLCGVYVGCAGADYRQLFEDHPPAQSFWGNNNSVIPARIAYYLDLHGPAIAVNTACSSSLVAVHLACQGLWTGETEMALAGGIFIQCTPGFYIAADRAGMLSPTGRCHTFDERADGFVPGEGVGVILLKRLREALADGDHIYGVIKGSGINQDGATNGITAPSANSQERLESRIYDTFKIDPGRIQMVEAHGTGTKLGDPLEYEALSRAFRKYTTKREYCAIGSIKTNIGHSATAAGIAGIIKILLSLQHQQIPPSLHFQSGNSHIRFEGSPFFVNTQLKEWKTEPGSKRLAAVSSFGFSGTNAHLVIEEAPRPERKHAGRSGYLIVLSARTLQQLQQQAEQLTAYCEAERNPDCGNISYTLLLGRKHWQHRLACVVQNQAELITLLKKWLETGKQPQIYQSDPPENGRREQSAMKRYGNQCIRNCQKSAQTDEYLENLAVVAELYVQGYELDFAELFAADRYTRISLPTYPFARESCWISRPQPLSDPKPLAPAHTAGLHPLLQQNTSNFAEQRFSSTFTGQEFFIHDHVIQGQKILPGVVYLEMARKAVEASLEGAALRDLAAGRTVLRLQNIVWTRPLTFQGEPVQVAIGLGAEEDGSVSYQVYSETVPTGERLLHNQGIAALYPAAAVPGLKLDALLARCGTERISAGQVYAAFKRMGLEYGAAFRGIAELYHVSPDQVLTKLIMPADVSGSRDQFGLHPGLMDSALQSAIGLMTGPGELRQPSGETALQPVLALALQEIEILGVCKTPMWALARYSDPVHGSGGANRPAGLTEPQIRKFDIDLADEQGMIQVRFKGLAVKAPDNGNLPNQAVTDSSPESAVGRLLLSPVWDVIRIKREAVLPVPTGKAVIVGGSEANRQAVRQFYPDAGVLEIGAADGIAAIVAQLESQGRLSRIIWFAPYQALASLLEEAVIQEQDRGVLQVFRLIKALLQLGYGTQELQWTVITTGTQAVLKKDTVNPAHAALYGLIASLGREYPNWKAWIVDLASQGGGLPPEVFALPPELSGEPLAYRDGEWYRQQLIPVEPPPIGRTFYRTQGVYVVIGGAGGIGVLWSEYMIRTYQARIVWIGRRAKDEAIQAQLDRLSGLGPAPCYIAADATDPEALSRAWETIKRDYKAIHGVVHSAVGALDLSLARMEEEQFRAGLAVKIDLCVRIAQVFQREPLDFALFFSSMASFVKDHGKSSYCAGSTFEDAYARQLVRDWPGKVKVVNWGYWGQVGIGDAVPTALKNRLAQMGIGTLEPAAAMEALEILLAGPMDQMMVLHTTKPPAMAGLKADEVIRFARPDAPVEVKAECQRLNQTLPPSAQYSSFVFRRSSLVVLKPKANSRQLLATHASRLAPHAYCPPNPRFQQRRPETGRKKQELERLLAGLLWAQLGSLGGFAAPHLALEEIKAQTGLQDRYSRWLAESLAVLTRHGYLEYTGDGWTVSAGGPVGSAAVWREWERRKESWLTDPYLRAEVILAETALRALPEILTGKVPATEVIFPNSALDLVEAIYKNNPVADYFNELLTDTLLNYWEERLGADPSRPIRLLEIGAGTGGTSALLFKKLGPYRRQLREYCYTDISKAFLLHAQKEYGPEYPYLTYRIFNVEEPPVGQGIEPGAYDIVIAANVLHATQDIRNTLRNAKAVLKPDGLLLLNEINGNSLLAHLTFGLLEGWWRYEDAILRQPGCPGLAPGTWQVVLENEGFGAVSFPARESHDLGQQIIAAVSDGVIRQKRTAGSGSNPRREIKASVPEAAAGNRSGAAPILLRTGANPEKLLRERSAAYIKKLVGEILRIPSHEIDAAEPLETYGIDSILIVQLTGALSKAFANISSTLLFECTTINALTDHLCQTQREAAIALAGPGDWQEAVPGTGEPAAVADTVVANPPLSKPGRFFRYPGPEPEEAGRQPSRREPIAIIGMSGRYPQAGNLREYWDNLIAGKDCITEIPAERWSLEGFYNPDPEVALALGQSYSKWGGFLEGFADFDPLFFNISPREALNMDPQERLFIESCWAVLEDAGYTREQLAVPAGRRVGVFAGITKTGFNLYGPGLWKEGQTLFPSTSFGSVANRVSYLLNLRGPSMPVDTMCSSSLAAIHEACEHIRRGECQLAIAGGVNLYLHPSGYTGLCRHRLLSHNNRSAAFGLGGNGFVPGEGVGCVLLKPLARAEQDGDHIYALIVGSHIDHNGTTNGYMVPNPQTQSDVMVANFRKSGIDPRTISYIETAAYGSDLGDSIEVNALMKAFAPAAEAHSYCALGSVKPNIGHLEAASGISQLTKVVLQLQYRQLVPLIHAEPLNPRIDLTDTPFYLPTEVQEWRRPRALVTGSEAEIPRRAAINSFGAGGLNAHLIVEEYRPRRSATAVPVPINSPRIMVFSAKNEAQLRQVIRQMLEYLQAQPDISLAALAYTLQVGREALDSRLALVIRNYRELLQGLRDYLNGNPDSPEPERSIPVFTENRDPQRTGLSELLSGKAGEAFFRTLWEEDDLEKLALYWTQGGKIPWQSLYRERAVRKLSLPTYPFARERYWFTPGNSRDVMVEEAPAATIGAGHPAGENLTDYLTGFLSRELLLTSDRINPRAEFRDYGADSVLMIKLIRDIDRCYRIRLTGRELLEYRSIQSLADYLATKINPAFQEAGTPDAAAAKQGPALSHYRDQTVIAALEKFKEGRLALKEVQILIAKEH